MVNTRTKAQKRNQWWWGFLLFPHLFFILLKFQREKQSYKWNKNFSWLGQNFQLIRAIFFLLFSKEIWLLLLYFEGNLLEKRCANFCEALQKDFFCHSGTEVVFSKAFKCGIMALNIIAVPFALAEGFKPCWQIHRTSYSASSVLLSKLLLSKTITHSPSIAIVLDRYSWPCGLVLCILQFQAVLASLGRNPFI